MAVKIARFAAIAKAMVVCDHVKTWWDEMGRV